ncbi:MAG: glycosyltransferase family 4 protein [Planctomycetota bacterium]|nr:glycosyltransferase family 4 protein [Planctomycetota bacterium]
MRIARVLTRLNLGGPARQVLASDPLLQERGHEVTVFAGSPEPGEGDLFDELEERGVSVRRVPGLGRGISPAKDLLAFGWLRRELNRLQPDLVHTHASKAGALGRRAAAPLARRGTALVHTFHGHVLEDYFPEVVSRRLIATERRLARTTDRILAVSHATADDLVRLEVVGEDDIFVVHPGVDLTPHLAFDLAERRDGRRPPGALRQLLGIAADAVLIGVVGRLAEVKRPELAIDVFQTLAARYPKAELAFVGDGDQRRLLEGLIRALPPELQARVHLAGNVSDSASIFGDLDVLLATSRNEGLPVAMIEAHAAGVPVVSTNVGGVGEVVAHERTGMLGADPDELAFHLDKLLADAGVRSSYASRARLRVATRYDARSLADRLEGIYLGTQGAPA